MEILIIGAGMGGFALAALLRQRGIGCTVVDRAKDLAQAGYILVLYRWGHACCSRDLAAWMATDSTPLIWKRDYFLRHANAESMIDNIATSLREPI